uniref:Putative secreted protein n=1 Tax=Anopheles marajoara TaxID=58244 RepID=A0A2M4C994_9DIPT
MAPIRRISFWLAALLLSCPCRYRIPRSEARSKHVIMSVSCSACLNFEGALAPFFSRHIPLIAYDSASIRMLLADRCFSERVFSSARTKFCNASSY